MITITASDGKEFKGNDYTTLQAQVDAYEVELEAKAEKEAEYEKKKLIALTNISTAESALYQLYQDYESTYGVLLRSNNMKEALRQTVKGE